MRQHDGRRVVVDDGHGQLEPSRPAYSPFGGGVREGDGVVGAVGVAASAVTLTVWAVFQLEVLKVRVLVLLRPDSHKVRAGHDPLSVTVTATEGRCDSLTV